MVTREVNSRNKTQSFKIKVTCHNIGNSKLGKMLQLIAISCLKAIFVLLCVFLFSKQA